MKIKQKTVLKLQTQLLQGFDLQMVQKLYALPGISLFDYVEEFCLENKAIEMKSHSSPHEVNFSLIAQDTSLYEHLLFQIETSFLLEEKERAKEIIASLDRNGFYEGGYCPVLEKIWSLDPVGIATSSPQKAMMVQLEESGKRLSVAYLILSKEYKAFLRDDRKELAKRLSKSSSEIDEAFTEIRKLNPFPGRGFDHDFTSYVFPELKLFFQKKWNLEFVKEYYPSVKLLEGARGKDKVEAQRLIYLLHQRKARLEYIVSQIVKQQDEYLKGKGKRKEVGRSKLLDDLNISASTLSRILSEKYIETPIGIFPLGHFFQKETSGKDAKELLKQLIEQENKNAPLSDEELSSKLNEEGVVCSRRTVAKYRKAMMIPGAYHRVNR